MSKEFKIVRHFAAIDAEPTLTQEQYLALKSGDRILVLFDEEQPEVRKIFGFGLRHPLMATGYLGHNYEYINVIGGHPNNRQTQHHLYEVHKSRIRGLAPAQ
jgi:hypothetical protein